MNNNRYIILVETGGDLANRRISWANFQGALDIQFATLPDVDNAFTTPHALYKTNAAADAYEETGITMPDGAADEIEFNKGTTNLNFTADFNVTSTCTLDQNLETTAEVDFGGVTVTIGETVAGGFTVRDPDTNPIAVLGDGSASSERGILQLYEDGSGTEDIRLIAGNASGSWINAGDLAIGKQTATSLLDIAGLTTTTSLKIGSLINDIVYGSPTGTVTGLALGNQDEPLLSNGTSTAPKFGTMRLAPAPQAAAGATPVDTDVSALNNDTFGTIVGTGGRVYFFWKNATDVYYVEALAL